MIAVISTISNATNNEGFLITCHKYIKNEYLQDNYNKGWDIVVGKTLQLYGILYEGNCVTNAQLNGVIWESSDNEVATIDSDGIVTGISKGNAVITGKYGTYEDVTFNIEVYIDTWDVSENQDGSITAKLDRFNRDTITISGNGKMKDYDIPSDDLRWNNKYCAMV